jgi:hypothetical protein
VILYKYYGFKAGIAALKSSQVGFREPTYFNDPFELSYLDNAEGHARKLNDWQQTMWDIKRSVSILSLTRTPFNPLMWAHYGQEHTGFVIGYDVSGRFFSDEDLNLVPVHRGDVVYTSSKIKHTVTHDSRALIKSLFASTLGLGHSGIDRNAIETLMRRFFLIKHSCWVYEEEVRIVKRIIDAGSESSSLGELSRTYSPSIEVAPGTAVSSVDGLDIYEHKVPVCEVYLGLRNPLVADHLYRADVGAGEFDSTLRTKATSEKWNIFALKMMPGTWQLEKQPIQPDRLLLVNRPAQGEIASISGAQMSSLNRALKSSHIRDGDRITLTSWRNGEYVKLNNQWL